MKFEYLILNIIIISGPLVFGSMRRFYFIGRWPYALFSIVIAAIPYLIWDAFVTGKHWMFNEAYTLDYRLAGLPLEEWLFFITVPFACLFSWEMILKYLPAGQLSAGRVVRYISFLFLVTGLLFFYYGKEYSGLVMFFLTLAVYIDKVLETDLVYQKSFYWYLLMISGFTLVFNGYLTARPVVLYGEAYQVGLRVFTIPIEDFGFGISLLYLSTVIYESLKKRYSKIGLNEK